MVDNRNPLAGTDFDDSLDDIFGPDTDVNVVAGDLKHIAELVAQARLVEGEIGVLEAKLVARRDHYKFMLESTIPEAMLACGMSDIGLADGTRVKIEPFHRGTITEKTKAKAHAWLENNGFGGLIKKDITVSFGKGADGFDGLIAYIREMQLPSKEKTAVHPQTLGAFIRTQAEKGDPVPADLFNVFSGSLAKLIKPAEKVPFA